MVERKHAHTEMHSSTRPGTKTGVDARSEAFRSSFLSGARARLPAAVIYPALQPHTWSNAPRHGCRCAQCRACLLSRGGARAVTYVTESGSRGARVSMRS
eukprot:6212166-Pleurochrysis_carterae.AAC.2